MSCGILENCFEECFSPQIENEITCIRDEIIQDSIVKEVTKARYFGILYSETTDIEHVNQVSFLLQYVDMNNISNHIFKDMFLECIPTVDVSGSSLRSLIINALPRADFFFIIKEIYIITIFYYVNQNNTFEVNYDEINKI